MTFIRIRKGHNALVLILTNVRVTIHVDSLTLLVLNINILLAKLMKPEKWNILTLTWSVTLSVISK